MIANYREIETVKDVNHLIATRRIITHCAFQDIDFNECCCDIEYCHFQDCLFLGCTFPKDFYLRTTEGCLIFESLDVPYNAFRSQLYNAASLYEGYDRNNPDTFKTCFDSVVYQHYLEFGKSTSDIKESLGRCIHDNSISGALHYFLSKYSPWQLVGVMGGHGLKRTGQMYRQIVLLSKKLTELGSLMVTGGGPGAMEATHLGAWMAGRTETEVEDALEIVAQAPSFSDEGWLEKAFDVMEKYPQHTYESLGIPTWLYGHEPSTPFATHIAKYFDNSIREDGILTIAMGGIVYSPGSAGTLQEIFQEAVQNHYLTYGYSSPMIFLGKHFWEEEVPIYPLMKQMLEAGTYKNLILSITDSAEDVVNEIGYFRHQMKDAEV